MISVFFLWSRSVCLFMFLWISLKTKRINMIYVSRQIQGLVKVNGRKLVIKEYPDYEFFSYRCSEQGYFICEKSTGLSLCWGKKLKLAKSGAISLIKAMGYSGFKSRVRTCIGRYGTTNKKPKKGIL